MLVLASAAGLLTIIIQLYQSKNIASESIKMRIQSLTKAKTQNFSCTHGSDCARTSTKLILMHSFPWWYELKSNGNYFSSCNYSCMLTLDVDLLSDADVVVVFSHHFTADSSSLLPKSSVGQIWVYFAVESPLNSYNVLFAKPEWHHVFNWTMTYRRDSDFYFGYGDFIKRSDALPKRDFSAIVSGKSKMVAWFVSNCYAQSKRGDIASALKEHFQVDIYGKCGVLKCDTEESVRCFDMLTKDYFFYLSFENSLCKDYVTEKLYRVMKQVDIIPVVYGGANYSSLLPKHSFIDVQQFRTIIELADFLRKVASDRNLYQSYLSWKNEWQVLEPVKFSFCDLCSHAHQPEKFHKCYSNVDDWWRSDTCWEPKEIIKS